MEKRLIGQYNAQGLRTFVKTVKNTQPFDTLGLHYQVKKRQCEYFITKKIPPFINCFYEIF